MKYQEGQSRIFLNRSKNLINREQKKGIQELTARILKCSRGEFDRVISIFYSDYKILPNLQN